MAVSLLFLATTALASPTPWLFPIPQPPSAPQPPHPPPQHACAKNVPDLWTVTDFIAHLTDDETVSKGNASFTLTNVQTLWSEELRCDLRFNYLCEWLPTPGTKEAQGGAETRVWLAMNEGHAAVTVNQPWSCGDGEKGQRVTGVVEVRVQCEGAVCKGEGSGDGEVLEEGGDLRRREGGFRLVKRGGIVEDGMKGMEKKTAVAQMGGVDGKVGERAVDGDWGRKGGLILKKLGDRAAVPPYAVPKAHEVKEEHDKGFLSMARKGRMMAQAWGHAKGKNPWVEVFQGRGGNGGRVMESKGVEVKENGEGKDKKDDKDKDGKKDKDEKKDEKKDEPLSEKKLIEQMEHRLCSPSCLRETTLEPDSGHQYSDGRRKPHS